MVEQPKRGRGRPRKGGKLRATPDGYKARCTVDIEGETVRRVVRVAIADPVVARRKIARTVRGELPVETSSPTGVESFAEAAARLLPTRPIARAGAFKDQVELYCYRNPMASAELLEGEKASGIWHKAARDVTPGDLAWLMKRMVRLGLDRSTVKSFRNSLRWLFATLADPAEGGIKVDPMLSVPLPKFPPKVDKVTETLDDSELLTYLAWEHPEPHHREAVYQRQVMSVVSRTFGGERAGSLALMTWASFARVGGRFTVGWALRTKKGIPQKLAVPPELAPVLDWWWERSGRPPTGSATLPPEPSNTLPLLFPTLRASAGAKVRAGSVRAYEREASEPGGARKCPTFARALRQDLKRAFGIEAWVYDPARKRYRWVVAREMTDREVALFTERQWTWPVDFHSWRRAYVQAVDAAAAGAGLRADRRAELSDHDDEVTRQGYLRRFGKALEAPAGAMPAWGGATDSGILGMVRAINQKGDQLTEVITPTIPASYGRARKDSNLRPTASEAPARVVTGVNPSETTLEAHRDEAPETPSTTDARLKSEPKITLTGEHLAELLALAQTARRWHLIAPLGEALEQAERVRQAAHPKVTDLATARRRKEER